MIAIATGICIMLFCPPLGIVMGIGIGYSWAMGWLDD